MIQIYAPGNRNYNRNGDAVLHPSQCDVEMNLKGDWQLTLENPADENVNLITKEAVIKCDTPIGKSQRFRIYDYEKSEDGVSAKARPVFFDAAKDAFILDKRPTNKTGKEALNILMDGTGYTGETDIMDFNTAYYVRKNLIEAINGEDENSFINRWGGEPIYQNEHLIMNKKYGSDRGAKATFGNNLQSITETVNMDQVVTRIIPMAYNGYMLEGDKPWVDSPNIGKYELIYTKVIEYSDVKLQEDVSDENEKGYGDLSTLRAELKRRAQQDFDNGIDLPAITYEVEVTDLENAVGYEDIKDLVKIGFGDDVTAENKRLNITTKNRCVGIVYDCIEQKNKSVTLGETQTDYFTQMASVQQKVNQSLTNTGVRGEMVYGLIDLVKASMKATAENAVLQKSKAILFEDKVAGSPSYGAMALGTTGFMIAAKRLPDDSDWDWRTFGTGQGFFADLIVAGTMLYDRCRGGTAEIGGINNTSGVLKILDAKGKEIGRWDKDGVKIYSGEINGPVIIAGGIGDMAGLIKILDETGAQIGRWGKDGLYVYSGGELRSKDYVDGQTGFKLDLTNGLIEAAQLLIKTAAQGRMERGFRFEDGSLKILGTDGETIAHVACTWSYPDGPDGVPSGWTGRVAFGAGEPRDNYFDSFWVNKTGACGIHSSKNIELTSSEGIEINGEEVDLNPGKLNINEKETKSGRIEFSDGTYIDIQNGYIVGGNSKAGAF
ncbi:MAG: phage tail protein [Clostridiales bacterium]|nr:phage tail protein [Clostridiales bacterium]